MRESQNLIPAVAYIRMSSDRQEASPDQQRAEVAKLATRDGYKIVREYFDEGISGDATEKRKAFRQMIRDAEEKGDFTAILCWDQDRFGRFDSIEAGRWIYPLRQAGVWLVTVAQGAIDWNDFTGRVMYSIVQEGKHQFLVDLSRNVLRGRISAAKAGRLIVTPPYGYDRLFTDPAGRESRRVPGGEKFHCPEGWSVRLVPTENPGEVENVRTLFHTFANTDCSIHALVQTLNHQGVMPRRGKGWSATALRYLLSNPVYVGQLVFGRRQSGKYHQVAESGDVGKPRGRAFREAPIVVDDAHEALVDRETFDRVQEKLASRRHGKAKPRYNGYILTGVLRCGHCGRPMSGRSAGAGRDRRYYTCPGGKTGQCKGYTVRQDYLDAYILDQIEKRILNPLASEQIHRAIHRQAKAKPGFQDPTEALRGQLAALDQKITKGAENLLLADAEHVSELSAMLAGWKRERAGLQNKLETLVVNASGTTAEERAARAVRELDKIRKHFESANPVMVRAAVKSMVDDIRLWWEPRGTRYRRVARGALTFRAGGVLTSSNNTASDRRRRESGAP